MITTIITFLHNFFSFIGHVDTGESDWVTALRETKEEAGLSENELDVSAACYHR